MAKFLSIFFFFTVLVCNSQIGNPNTVNQNDPNNTSAANTGEVAQDSIIFKAVFDNEHAASLDQKWLEDLYGNNTLYDTVYESVTDLSFEKVEYPELPTETLKARLKALDAKTPFNVEYNEGLESVIKTYLKNRREILQRLITLSSYYFPMFEQELDNHNIPLEIKYLAVVESALKPRAKSRVGATGLWQFMYGTGIEYGLDVTSYVDERSDPIKSTAAAAKYLSKLHDIFDDWDLALAAYNSGPGNVTKAIRRSGGYKNYWNIRHNLPRETAGYLPAFLANMYIFEYAEEHGFKKYKPEFAYVETDTIRVKQMITLDQVSEVTDVDIEELQFLNPSYKLDIIPHVKDKNYTLRLPMSAIGTFVTNEEAIYAYAQAEFDKREKPMPQLVETNDKTTTYVVRSGDNLGKLSRKFGVKLSQIKLWNKLKTNTLLVGQRLTIYSSNYVAPTPTSVTSSTASTVATTNNKSINASLSGDIITYTVKSGDSLWSISQKFPGVSVNNIKEWNDIRGSKLKPGMKLKISKG